MNILYIVFKDDYLYEIHRFYPDMVRIRDKAPKSTFIVYEVPAVLLMNVH